MVKLFGKSDRHFIKRMCALQIPITEPAREAYQRLHSSRTPFHTIILKPNVQTQEIELVAEYPEGKHLDELINQLPSSEARFIIHMPERIHADERKSYPIVLIAYSPKGLSPQSNIIYTNSRSVIVRDFQIPFTWDIKRKLEMGDEELKERFETNKW